MARKPRIGLRCYNPYVPGEIWELFKPAFRALIKIGFPGQKLSVTEFYWQGFMPYNEYIRITPKDDIPVDWKRVWKILAFSTEYFFMKIDCLYKEDNGLEILHEDTLFPRAYADYSLKSSREWTLTELDGFLANYSFDEMKQKFRETINNRNND